MSDLVKAFDPHVRSMINDVSNLGYDAARNRWSLADGCGCMGCMNDEPFCPCVMRQMTVKIVENLRKEAIRSKIDELRNSVFDVKT